MSQDQFDLDLLLRLDRGDEAPLRAQLERELRAGIRDGRLVPGTALPSTRALARGLGVSRGVVVDAYEQLAAEGWLATRQGAPTRVAAAARPEDPGFEVRPEAATARFDFHTGTPDLSAFPRAAWSAAVRRALASVPDSALGYGDGRGAAELRAELAPYLGRVRGTVARPDRIVVTNGLIQGIALVCRALAWRGGRRVAMEDPGFRLHRESIARAGLEPVPVPVDAAGIQVDRLAELDVDAVLLTPAHQFPTGVVLAPERRSALLDWAENAGALVVEDDYDAEYRYDREPVGAVQGLAPERVVSGGTASKTLAPGVRLAWLVTPSWLVDEVAGQKLLEDGGAPLIDQLALAELIARGDLDRHLRRTRLRYRARRDALLAALARDLPDASVRGAAAGLYLLVELPASVDEERLLEVARERGLVANGLAPHRVGPGPPGLVLGYANVPEETIARGVAELAACVREVSPAGRPSARRGSRRGRGRTRAASPSARSAAPDRDRPPAARPRSSRSPRR